MMRLQWQLSPGKVLPHRLEELHHCVKLLLALPLLHSFTNQFLEGMKLANLVAEKEISIGTC